MTIDALATTAAPGAGPPATASSAAAAGAPHLVELIGTLDPSAYVPHPLHAAERVWSETNCYVDLWIELLHALGCDPLASCAFALSTDFEGDQWTFFKVPPEDLRRLYGIEIAELNVWRPLATHIAEQLELGRLLTVEVDAYFLPDTRGVSYRSAHQKTTIVPASLQLDGAAPRLSYFHNASFFELTGDDLAGALRVGAEPEALAPYVEVVKIERLDRLGGPELAARSLALAGEHLARRPLDNPVARLGARLQRDLEWLCAQDLDAFHAYAFGTCRQCGASAELGAAYVEWLERATGLRTGAAVPLREVAEGAKTMQFALARIAAGRRFDLAQVIETTAASWQEAMDRLVRRLG